MNIFPDSVITQQQCDLFLLTPPLEVMYHYYYYIKVLLLLLFYDFPYYFFVAGTIGCDDAYADFDGFDWTIKKFPDYSNLMIRPCDNSMPLSLVCSCTDVVVFMHDIIMSSFFVADLWWLCWCSWCLWDLWWFFFPLAPLLHSLVVL